MITSVFDDPQKKKLEPEVQRVMNKLATDIRKIRTRRMFSQHKVAQRSGKTQKMVCNLEAAQDFHFSTFLKMCFALNVQPVITFKPWHDPAKRKPSEHEARGVELGLLDDDLKPIELSDYQLRKLRKNGTII